MGTVVQIKLSDILEERLEVQFEMTEPEPESLKRKKEEIRALVTFNPQDIVAFDVVVLPGGEVLLEHSYNQYSDYFDHMTRLLFAHEFKLPSHSLRRTFYDIVFRY